MGTKRAREKQEEMFYASERVEAPGHPFYEQLNGVLDGAGFDQFCEEQCRDFYHTKLGRPSLAPGVYFRLLLIGFFEGIGSERGIGWRVADSLSLRRFLNYGLDKATPSVKVKPLKAISKYQPRRALHATVAARRCDGSECRRLTHIEPRHAEIRRVGDTGGFHLYLELQTLMQRERLEQVQVERASRRSP